MKFSTELLVATLVAISLAATARAAPTLVLPIDCEVGKACVVQNYVDDDPGPGARDYRCGFLTYDGHKGTDIRVIDEVALKRGVAVLAAAPGRVRAIRDGMPDVNVRTIGKAAIAGREAGNSVVIEHGDGWETQYAHMRRGSISVRAGDTVKAGQKLGVVGLSGNTEFPHLHFEVRYHGKTIDPFLGLDSIGPCAQGSNPLWRADADKVLAYVATGVLDADLSGGPPGISDGNIDHAQTATFSANSDALVFWVQIYGAQDNDLEDLRLLAPDGHVLAERRGSIARNRAQWVAYVGIRRGPAGWPAGVYRGEYALYRGPQERRVVSIAREFDAAAAARHDSDSAR